jgi:O-antigen ligase
MFLCAAVVLSRSRGGLLAIAVQIIFAGLLFVNFKSFASESRVAGRRWMRWARSILATTVIAAALVLMIIVGVGSLGGDQLSTGVETATVEMAGADPTQEHIGSRRRDIWRATWSMFKVHPIAGAGLGAFWAEVPVFHDASGVSTPQQAHNDYLELLASGGILGAALFVWFAVELVRQARRSIRAGEGFQRAVSMGAILGLAGVGVHSIVDFGLHITINALVFVVLLGLLSLKSFGPQTPMKRAR